MAQVEQTVKAQVDWLLRYLFRSWSSVPEAVRGWKTWDNIEKEVFQLEWAIPESHLETLRAHVEAGKLTAEQLEQYERLLELIERYRPELDGLFADKAA